VLRVVCRRHTASAAFVFGFDGDAAAAASFATIRSGGSSHVGCIYLPQRLRSSSPFSPKAAEFCWVRERRTMAILGLDTAFKKALFLGYMSLWVSRKSALPTPSLDRAAE
jgi:hypothetical protein